MELNFLVNNYSNKDIKIDNKRNDKIEEFKEYLKNLFSFLKKYLFIAAIIIMIIVIFIFIILSRRLPERFYGIIPSFVKPNSFGFFESNKNGLENIPKSKIEYIRKEYGYIQKIEQSQMGNIEGNVENSLQADITIYHSKFNFDSKINELFEENRKFSYFIVKYIYGFINIKTEDIKLDKTFQNEINKIAFEDEFNDKEKADKIDKLFENYGFYIPQKIYLGASYIRKINNSNNSKKQFFDFKGKLNIMNISEIETNYEKNSIMSFLNSMDKTVITGGNKYATNFEDWKSSINEDNIDIIGYDNFLEITQLLDFDLKKRIKVPLDLIQKKYKLRKQYYNTIKTLKESLSSLKKVGDSSSTQGICNKDYNELIYSKPIPIDEKWKILGGSNNYNQCFQDIIVGWKIKGLKQLNGNWEAENPILKHEINLNFYRDLWAGYSYDIEVMKEPEIYNL